MDKNYKEDDFVNEELSNDELFRKHVVKEDFDLLQIDKLLSSAFGQIEVE